MAHPEKLPLNIELQQFRKELQQSLFDWVPKGMSDLVPKDLSEEYALTYLVVDTYVFLTNVIYLTMNKEYHKNSISL